MADEITPSSVVPICPPGATADPLGHKTSLEETLASLSQNMGHMADMMGKMYDRLNENDDVLSQRPPGSREKRQRRRPPTDSESDPKEEDRPHGKSRRTDDDALSVHASNSDDEVNDLLNGSNPPGSNNVGDKADNEAALLKELEAALHDADKKGLKIQQQLADIAVKRWGKKMNAEKVSSILAKHVQPENCEELNIPRVNPEIWATLNAFKRKADLRFANMQQLLQKATVALLSTCNKLLAVKSQVETKEMLTDSVDAIALVGHVASELSALRREHLKPSLRPEFHAICANNATTTSTLLFGDDLAKQIRDAKETNRLSKTVAGPSQQLDHNKGYQRHSSWSNKASEKHHKGGSRPLFLGKGHRSAGKKKPYPDRTETDKK
ncbi:uncharacterized protein [Montipora foliosa]|uniref:uncharacterized protein n=1 Tax=Montipora foliosa TaxID=591990 RepID=UPI0035F1823B